MSLYNQPNGAQAEVVLIREDGAVDINMQRRAGEEWCTNEAMVQV